MAKPRVSIFEESDEPAAAKQPAGLDLSGFAPKAAPDSAAPPAATVRAVSKAQQFRSCDPRPAAPTGVSTGAPAELPRAALAASRPARRYRTGRNVQFNVEVSQATLDAFYAVADHQGWVLGETLEHALAALQRELALQTLAWICRSNEPGPMSAAGAVNAYPLSGDSTARRRTGT